MGVEEYREEPQYFRGETGAQSTIIPALDAALGITHADDPLTVYLAEMRHYMPPAHRAFLEMLEHQQDHQGRPRLAGFIHDHQSRHPEMWSAYCQSVQLLARFGPCIWIMPQPTFINKVKNKSAIPLPWEETKPIMQ